MTTYDPMSWMVSLNGGLRYFRLGQHVWVTHSRGGYDEWVPGTIIDRLRARSLPGTRFIHQVAHHNALKGWLGRPAWYGPSEIVSDDEMARTTLLK